MKKSMFEEALEMANSVVPQIDPAKLGNATPCAKWDVRAVLNHIFNELAWVPELLAGKTMQQVGDALDGDLVGADVAHNWRNFAATARTMALQTSPERVVHLSYGNVPAKDYLEEVAGDIAVHTWDVAKALGEDFHINDVFADMIYGRLKPHISSWRSVGLVGDEVPVAATAPAEQKLLGLFGRDYRWQPWH